MYITTDSITQFHATLFLSEYCPKDYIFDPELSVCFKLYPTSSTYSKSVAVCEKEGSKLMKIDSQKTQTMVEYHLRECRYHFSQLGHN